MMNGYQIFLRSFRIKVWGEELLTISMSPEFPNKIQIQFQNVPRTRFRFDNALYFNVLNQHLRTS